MQKISVKISSILVEDAFRTGATHKSFVITKGLPKDAKLLGAHVDPVTKCLELEFEAMCGKDRESMIEISSLVDL